MSRLRVVALALMLMVVAASTGWADGIGIDPNGGKPRLAAAGDHRCTIDPNGSGCVQ